MAAPPVIRRLGPEDIAAWSTLRAELWPGADVAAWAHAARLQLRAADRFAVFLADADGEAAGFCECSRRDHAEGCTSSPVGFLDGWYVRPAHRGRGLGRALVVAAERWARGIGCRELASDTALGDAPAAAAHAQLGFREVARVVCFVKDLHA